MPVKFSSVITVTLVCISLAYSSSGYCQCLAGSCNLQAHVVTVEEFGESSLSAFTELVLEKNVEIRDAPGKLGYISNLGKKTIFGEQSRAAGIYAGDQVVLHKRSLVEKRLFALLVTEKSGAKLPKLVEKPVDSHLLVNWKIEFPSLVQLGITVEPDVTQHIAPGYYKELTLKPKSTAVLTTGTYYFDKLVSEQGSVFQLKNENGTLIVNIRNELAHGGVFKFHGAPSDIMVTFHSTKTVEIASEFDGSLVAPNAIVVLHPQPEQTHDGIFYADSILVKAGAQIQKARVSQKGEAFAAMKPFVSMFSHQENPYPLDATTTEDELPFADNEIGRLLNDHFFKMYSGDENSIEEYEKSLKKLQEKADEVIAEIASTYYQTPETIDTQIRRLTLVEIMRSLQHEAAYQPLADIALSKIDPGILEIKEEHDFYPTKYEDIIRVRAISGIADSGHPASESMLLEVMANGSDFQKIYAARGYLNAEDREQRIAIMRTTLPEDLHYLTDLNADPSH